MKILSGYKTYLAIGGGILALVGYHFGFLSSDNIAEIISTCLLAGLGFTRAGVKKEVSELKAVIDALSQNLGKSE